MKKRGNEEREEVEKEEIDDTGDTCSSKRMDQKTNRPLSGNV